MTQGREAGPLVAAVLAAGSARRFGGGKLDTVVGGKMVGRIVLDRLCALPVDHVLLIVPPAIPRFASGGLPDKVELVINGDAADGMGTSLALAADRAIDWEADALLVVLADMPLVREDSLRALIMDDGTARQEQLRAARYPDGRLGPPALFGAQWLDELSGLSGDKGARDLLQRESAYVSERALSETEAFDLDRPDDLARLYALWTAQG